MRFGQQAEEVASIFLEEQGYKIVKRNYRKRVGEIDIIASCQSNSDNYQFIPNNNSNLEFDNSKHYIINPIHDTLAFIEVKARRSIRYGLPAEAVSFPKQKKIIAAALHYIREHKITDRRIRFDVVTIIFENGKYQMELIQNAFQNT